MTEAADPLVDYLQHIEARLRCRQRKAAAGDVDLKLAVMPAAVEDLCRSHPRACLELILRALHAARSPEIIAAIGDGLLANLLNENADSLSDAVSEHLRIDKRFRQAFGVGILSSVDPATIAEWVGVLQDLGTTKEAERKSLWRERSRSV